MTILIYVWQFNLINQLRTDILLFNMFIHIKTPTFNFLLMESQFFTFIIILLRKTKKI